MATWLKLIGTSSWRVPDAWAIERKELLSELRFSETHPPDPDSARRLPGLPHRW